MARHETITCDGCKTKMDPDRQDRIIHLQGFSSCAAGDHELDVCRDCWRKMLAAIGLKPDRVGASAD